ncbi:MAG: 4Fe-4S binding protein [Candidatus Lokiarchaeota archaeon]
MCLKEDFCFHQLFELKKNDDGSEDILFRKDGLSECYKCLKCFKACPNNAIIPDIE